MKKRFLLIVLIQLLIMNLFGQSIGDLTLIHIPTGKMYNFFDSVELFFNCVGKDIPLDEIIINGHGMDFSLGHKYYKDDGWNINVERIEFKMSDGIKAYLENAGAKHPETLYQAYGLEVFKDFKTVRGIGIGSDAKDVIAAYSDIKGYPDLRYYDNADDFLDISNVDKLPKNLKYLVCKYSLFQYKRSYERENINDYYLEFELDKNKKVKKILIFTYVDGV